MNSTCSFGRLHEQLNESDDAAQCYMLYIQDIFSCGVSISKYPNMSTNLRVVMGLGHLVIVKAILVMHCICTEETCF